MREQYIYYSMWLLIIGSWVFGVVFGKWGGGTTTVFAELGQAVGVPQPATMSWWQPLLYFPVTVVAAFMLSQIFFGAGAAIFFFARGVADSALLLTMESMIGNWNILSIPGAELWHVFFMLLVLTVNLPLTIWAAHLGTQRSFQVLSRVRGKPTKPGTGGVPFSNLIMCVTVSFIIGLMGSFALAYAQAA
ncbi:MAG: hypothetical protein AB1305_02485 [Candidatus Hadarchaeota archaeon]